MVAECLLLLKWKGAHYGDRIQVTKRYKTACIALDRKMCFLTFTSHTGAEFSYLYLLKVSCASKQQVWCLLTATFLIK